MFDDDYSDPRDSQDSDDGLTEIQDTIRGPMRAVPDPDMSLDSPDEGEADDVKADDNADIVQRIVYDHQEGSPILSEDQPMHDFELPALISALLPTSANSVTKRGPGDPACPSL